MLSINGCLLHSDLRLIDLDMVDFDFRALYQYVVHRLRALAPTPIAGARQELHPFEFSRFRHDLEQPLRLQLFGVLFDCTRVRQFHCETYRRRKCL